MTQEEQQQAFADDLGRLVDRYANEFEMTFFSMIGCLELQKARLARWTLDQQEEEEGDKE
jgi:hypothetical protein